MTATATIDAVREALEQAATRYEEILDDGISDDAYEEDAGAVERDLLASLTAFKEVGARLLVVESWLTQIRARLVYDNDAVADVDLLLGIYNALTGEDIPHPYDLDDEEEARVTYVTCACCENRYDAENAHCPRCGVNREDGGIR